MNRKFFKNNKELKAHALETIFVSKMCMDCSYTDQFAAEDVIVYCNKFLHRKKHNSGKLCFNLSLASLAF